MPPIEGKNLGEVKRSNLEMIKTVFYRYAPISRAAVAERLHLTPATISNNVAALIERGIIRELPDDSVAEGSVAIGRKPIYLDLVPDYRFTLGIFLGRDGTSWCLCDLRGGVLASGQAPLMPEDYAEMMDALTKLIAHIQDTQPAFWSQLLGIGIAIPGIVDSHTGMVVNHGSERGSWCGQPMGQALADHFGLPVRLDNNVRGRACMVSLFRPELIGENANYAHLHVGWGIACPMVIGNKAFRGEDAAAGEIGKMIMNPLSREDVGVYGPGTLESFSSMHAVQNRCQTLLRSGYPCLLRNLCPDPADLTVDRIIEAQALGDRSVCDILSEACFYLGIALANLVNIINPGLILLSGRIFRNPENIRAIEASLQEYMFLPRNSAPELRVVPETPHDAALGAAASCIEKHFLRNENV